MRKGLLLVAILSASCCAHAGSMGGVGNYSAYNPTPVVTPSKVVTLSSTIQGYVNISGIPPGIYHQAQITITGINYATGASVAHGKGLGPQVFPTTNINYTYAVNFNAEDGIDYDINEQDQVYCSFEGTFFFSFLFGQHLGVGYTLVENKSSPSGFDCQTNNGVTMCSFLVAPSCTNTPQWAPLVVDDGPPAEAGWYSNYACQRANSSQSWSCLPIPTAAFKTTNTGPVLCPFYPIF